MSTLGTFWRKNTSTLSICLLKYEYEFVCTSESDSDECIVFEPITNGKVVPQKVTEFELGNISNKKSRIYGRSDLSIYQLCYHMGSTPDPLPIHSQSPPNPLLRGDPLSKSSKHLLIGLERLHDFWEGIL